MIRDFGGGSPCGGYVYCDDGLPETYRGRIFHCEWGQGKVLGVKVAPDGARFKFVDQIALLEPNGVKDFRPFSLRPTADGRGFYVTDWGYSGWLSKVKAGRLWKVTYTGDDAKPAPRGKDTDSIEQLIESLDHPAHTDRLRAYGRLGGERRKPSLPWKSSSRGIRILRKFAVIFFGSRRRSMCPVSRIFSWEQQGTRNPPCVWSLHAHHLAQREEGPRSSGRSGLGVQSGQGECASGKGHESPANMVSATA